jgi:endonuclease YncB( thermonuclease family)
VKESKPSVRSQTLRVSWAARHKTLSAALSASLALAVSGLLISAFRSDPEVPRATDAAGPQRSGTVTDVVDGDTVDVEGIGRIRILGIDTPERGACGYEESSDLMTRLVLGRSVVLTPAADKDDMDKYGRLLRYVDVGDLDAGLEQIRAGHAVATYDSRDGYGAHPREDLYVTTDQQAPTFDCAASAPQALVDLAPTRLPTGLPTTDDAGPAESWTQPGPDLDCSDVGKAVEITGPDYHRLDADHDGWGCESYG